MDLSSNERTMAPSDFVLINSYKPGNPVTETILLYSILLFLRMCKINRIWKLGSWDVLKIFIVRGELLNHLEGLETIHRQMGVLSIYAESYVAGNCFNRFSS